MVHTVVSAVAALVLLVAAAIMLFLVWRALQYFTCSLSPWAVVVAVLSIWAALFLFGYLISHFLAPVITIFEAAQIPLFRAAFLMLRAAVLVAPLMFFHADVSLGKVLLPGLAIAGIIFIESVFGDSFLTLIIFVVFLLIIIAAAWFAWRSAPALVVATTATAGGAAVVGVAGRAGALGAKEGVMSRRNDGKDLLRGSNAAGASAQLTHRSRFAQAGGGGNDEHKVDTPLIDATLGASMPLGDTIYGAQVPVANNGGFASILANIVAAILLALSRLGCAETSLHFVIAFAAVLHGLSVYIAAPTATTDA